MKNSLPLIVVPPGVRAKLSSLPENAEVVVDLASQSITLPDGRKVEFPVLCPSS